MQATWAKQVPFTDDATAEYIQEIKNIGGRNLTRQGLALGTMHVNAS